MFSPGNKCIVTVMRSSGWHSRKRRSTDHSPRNGADRRRGANLISIVSPELVSPELSNNTRCRAAFRLAAGGMAA